MGKFAPARTDYLRQNARQQKKMVSAEGTFNLLIKSHSSILEKHAEFSWFTHLLNICDLYCPE